MAPSAVSARLSAARSRTDKTRGKTTIAPHECIVALVGSFVLCALPSVLHIKNSGCKLLKCHVCQFVDTQSVLYMNRTVWGDGSFRHVKQSFSLPQTGFSDMRKSPFWVGSPCYRRRHRETVARSKYLHGYPCTGFRIGEGVVVMFEIVPATS